MDSIIFDAFINLKQYSLNGEKKINDVTQPATDGEILFHRVIKKMKEKGVQFSSPGNSSKRNFIVWYNAQISTEITYPFQLVLDKKDWELIQQIVSAVNK